MLAVWTKIGGKKINSLVLSVSEKVANFSEMIMALYTNLRAPTISSHNQAFWSHYLHELLLCIMLIVQQNSRVAVKKLNILFI